MWAQSYTNPTEIYIFGGGVQRLHDDLASASKQFPGYKFTAADSGPLHTEQYCNNQAQIEHMRAQQDGNWYKIAQSSCNIILVGTEKNVEPNLPVKKFLYAAFPAHQVIDGEHCVKLAAGAETIGNIRAHIDQRASTTKYLLKIQQTEIEQVNLLHPTMVAYRHYYNNVGNPTTDNPDWKCCGNVCRLQEMSKCPHTYANDIAILKIETPAGDSEPVERLRHQFKLHNLLFHQLPPTFNMQNVISVTERGCKVYLKKNESELELKLMKGFETGGQSSARTYAGRITFVIKKKLVAMSAVGVTHEELIPGDSGQILYLKAGGRKLALAMFIGKITGSQSTNNSTTPSDFYEAILLNQALREIVMDYGHHVVDLHTLSPV